MSGCESSSPLELTLLDGIKYSHNLATPKQEIEDNYSSDISSPNAAKSRTKTCRVCGDIAAGFNFGIVTCESCKSFFRRNQGRDTKLMRFAYSYNPTVGTSSRYCNVIILQLPL